METTLRAKWWVFNAALPYLKASGDGAVINISSIAGIVGKRGPASDVVKAVRFILKDASFLTGSLLRLDGGYVLGGEKVGPMPEGVIQQRRKL